MRSLGNIAELHLNNKHRQTNPTPSRREIKRMGSKNGGEAALISKRAPFLEGFLRGLLGADRACEPHLSRQ